jgi:hypothetical protein
MDFTRLTSVPLRDPDAREEGAMNAIREALAMLDAISYGELFAAVPASSHDRGRHQSGIVLLEVLRQRLKDALENSDL